MAKKMISLEIPDALTLTETEGTKANGSDSK